MSDSERTPLQALSALLGPALVADMLAVAERDEASQQRWSRGDTVGGGAIGMHIVPRSTVAKWLAEGPPAHIEKHAKRAWRELEWMAGALPEGITVHAVLHTAKGKRKCPYEYLRVGQWDGFRNCVTAWLERREAVGK